MPEKPKRSRKRIVILALLGAVGALVIICLGLAAIGSLLGGDATPTEPVSDAIASQPETEAESTEAPTQAPTDTPLPTNTATATATSTPEPMGVIVGSVKIRTGPGEVFSVSGSVFDGHEFTILSQTVDGVWYEVEGRSSHGWVQAEALTDITNPDAIPVNHDLPPTPTATNTPQPTNTPRPTNTPTVTPTPIILTGSGDSVVDFVKTDAPSIAHIVGNAGGRHFAVVSYGVDGERIDLLVNTSDPYDGVIPIDFLIDEHTARFEITATGSWTIEIKPLTDARMLGVPGEISGTGDDVIVLTGASPDTATITGNASGRHFAVLAYGNGRDLLVNTADPYEGTVILDRDTIVLVIKAVGAWTISIDS